MSETPVYPGDELTPTVSLVGSSVRCADDTSEATPPPNTKSKSKSKSKKKKKSKASVTTSLDDLISEGALLASEEDFAEFLDDSGNVKSEIVASVKGGPKELTKNPSKDEISKDEISKEEISKEEISKGEIASNGATAGIVPGTPDSVSATPEPPSPVRGTVSEPSHGDSAAASYDQDHYTPSLMILEAEGALLSSSDLLPSHSVDDLSQHSAEPTVVPARVQFTEETPEVVSHVDSLFTVPAGARDGSASPFIHARSSSRVKESLNLNPHKPLNMSKPHLARGDSYQNTHDRSPSPSCEPEVQELVGEELVEEEDEADRTGRTGRTVTSGVDRPKYTRSASSQAYLRSISRSRSRQPSVGSRVAHHEETNEVLTEEGALIGGNLDMRPDLQELADKAYGEEKHSNLHEHSKVIAEAEEDEEPADGDVTLTQETAKESSGELAALPLVETPEVPNGGETGIEPNETEEITKEIDEPLVGVSKPIQAKDLKAGEPGLAKTEAESKQDAGEEITPAVEKSVQDIAKVDPVTTAEATDNEPVSGFQTVSNGMNSAIDESPSVEAPSDGPGEETSFIEAVSNESASNEPTAKEPVINTEDELISDTRPVTEVEPASHLLKDAALVSEPVSKEEATSDNVHADATLTKEALPSSEPIAVSIEATKIEEENDVPGTDVPAESEANEATAPAAQSKGSSVDFTDDDFAGISESDLEKEFGGRDLDTLVTKSNPSAKVTTITDDDFSGITAAEIEKEFGAKKPEATPVFVFSSFAGGFQVASRTRRLESILQANEIKFVTRDLGTDDEAKKIWRRYSNGKTLPGVVKNVDDFIGNWQDLEDANEHWEVRDLVYSQGAYK
ncbi:hypothetical protein BABINDRAFT_160384 [Babjeviella inositovora NRRL Y-12698]|uniref:Uncharacterized protein n=1 Tax=Babjeviella inositovora NRRL Y-12698 TaxID=984486 RepID=A0A1E3QVG0_9ASCO|nr:uncharacterized protein BABINDRAFT_160384 [Babjeviella inositovora NRRL Y-12698]ODQ80947.1 hypothetical protein BABINDRAFT_160384 [Babjeviella inositovora NRRL Y-12698]